MDNNGHFHLQLSFKGHVNKKALPAPLLHAPNLGVLRSVSYVRSSLLWDGRTHARRPPAPLASQSFCQLHVVKKKVCKTTISKREGEGTRFRLCAAAAAVDGRGGHSATNNILVKSYNKSFNWTTIRTDGRTTRLLLSSLSRASLPRRCHRSVYVCARRKGATDERRRAPPPPTMTARRTARQRASGPTTRPRPPSAARMSSSLSLSLSLSVRRALSPHSLPPSHACAQGTGPFRAGGRRRPATAPRPLDVVVVYSI